MVRVPSSKLIALHIRAQPLRNSIGVIIFQASCRQFADSDAPGVKIRPDVVIQHIAVLVIGRNSQIGPVSLKPLCHVLDNSRCMGSMDS